MLQFSVVNIFIPLCDKITAANIYPLQHPFLTRKGKVPLLVLHCVLYEKHISLIPYVKPSALLCDCIFVSMNVSKIMYFLSPMTRLKMKGMAQVSIEFPNLQNHFHFYCKTIKCFLDDGSRPYLQ